MPEPEAVDPEIQAEENSYQPPADIRLHLANRREEFERRFDTLDSQGMPEAEKQAILDREFPEFEPAERKEWREAREQEQTRLKQNVGRTATKSKSPSRRGRETGPSENRKESDYR